MMSFLAHPVQVCKDVESHRGAHRGAPVGKKFFDIFLKWRILVYFIFLGDGETPQSSQGPG